MITEVDEVSDALAGAATRWPGLPAAELLRRLLTEGHAAPRTSVARERAAVERTSGALTGTYQPGDLDALRREWRCVIVLDACVVIAHVVGDDAHHERATRLLVGLAGRAQDDEREEGGRRTR